jgi:hypothetical protein
VAYDETTLADALLAQDDLLTSGTQTVSEAEQEILTYVMRNQNNGERTSIEEILRNFGKRPYGWYPMAVLTLVSRLFRMGKVELRTTELLDARGALELLKNTRQHGSVRVRLQEQFDATKVNALKNSITTFLTAPMPARKPAPSASSPPRRSPPKPTRPHRAAGSGHALCVSGTAAPHRRQNQCAGGKGLHLSPQSSA